MKTPLTLALLALLALGATACSHTPPVPGGAKKPPDCALEILRTPPTRPYEVLEQISNHVMNVPAAGAVEAMRPRACALGADALIVTREQVLNYFGHTLVEGNAIRWVAPAAAPAEAPAAPAAPATPAPTPEPSPKPSP